MGSSILIARCTGARAWRGGVGVGGGGEYQSNDHPDVPRVEVLIYEGGLRPAATQKQPLTSKISADKKLPALRLHLHYRKQHRDPGARRRRTSCTQGSSSRIASSSAGVIASVILPTCGLGRLCYGPEQVRACTAVCTKYLVHLLEF
jgi:hypothetical protein